MNKKSWIIFSVVAVGILALLVFTAKNSESDSLKGVDIYAVQKASDQNGQIADHVFGKADSLVTLIEYGDYQCAPCASVHPLIKTVVTDYKDKIRFVFRNFPIPTLHQNALTASTVAEAAGLQDKYWEMHDKLYENQTAWADLTTDKRIDYFSDLANQLKLNVSKFKSDLSLQSISDKIKYDQALAEKTGVQGTPSMYLNGTKLDGEALNTVESLKAILDAELKKTNK